MNKKWIKILDYLSPAIDRLNKDKDCECNINVHNPYYKEFRWALFNGLKKEYDIAGLKMIEDIVIFDLKVKELLKEIKKENFYCEILTDSKNIYGIIIFSFHNGFFLENTLSVPLICLTEKSDIKDSFKLIKRLKELVKKIIKNGNIKNIMVDYIVVKGKAVRHSMRVMREIEKIVGEFNKGYEVYCKKLS